MLRNSGEARSFYRDCLATEAYPERWMDLEKDISFMKKKSEKKLAIDLYDFEENFLARVRCFSAAQF